MMNNTDQHIGKSPTDLQDDSNQDQALGQGLFALGTADPGQKSKKD